MIQRGITRAAHKSRAVLLVHKVGTQLEVLLIIVVHLRQELLQTRHTVVTYEGGSGSIIRNVQLSAQRSDKFGDICYIKALEQVSLP